MTIRLIILIITLKSFSLFSQGRLALYAKFNSKPNIVIKVKADTLRFLDSAKLEFMQSGILGAQWISTKARLFNNEAIWSLYSDKPITVYLEKYINIKRKFWMVEPGDSIVAEYHDKSFVFSGEGIEKMKLQQEMDSVLMSIKAPQNPNTWVAKSLQDFLDMHRYSTQKLNCLLPLIESYEHKLSSFAYNTIRIKTISRVQEDKLDKFSDLVRNAKRLSVTNRDLCNIFDSCFYNDHWRWVVSNDRYGPGWYAFIRAQLMRKYEFEPTNDSMNVEVKRKYLYYAEGKKTYSGLALQGFLLDLIANHTIHEIGFVPETEKLLSMYYADQDVSPEYKQYVKAYEQKERILVGGKRAPDFSLMNADGRAFTKAELKGKIALLSFWGADCSGCLQMSKALKKVQDRFKGDSNVVFLNISTDKDKVQWINSLKYNRYSTEHGVNLYTGGEGNEHVMMKTYSISEYPSLHLIDAFGKIVQNPLPDPRDDDGNKLCDLIQEQCVLMKDGPYVIYNHNTASALSTNFSSVSCLQFDKKKRPLLMVQTDNNNENFTVRLKTVLKVEPSEFKQPNRLLVLSDIEGNFDVLRRILQYNGIIDSNYNWIFGEGHLVFNGDIFDRGNQVTECLWLIYSLEEKAKKANGYVHFILGNHEIMNLSGNVRYVQPKYIENAQKLNRQYSELYDGKSELGRWLRTKNIIEKIGNLLFVHAGISNGVNRLPLSIKQLNYLARPNYDKDSIGTLSTDFTLKILFDSRESPFWYRLYYQDAPRKVYTNGDTVYKAPMKQINETLVKFGVEHIVTGHTIIADTVSVHYDGKVINTDTRHADGKSEALLIEGDIYYRVDIKGNRHFLFKDDSEKNTVSSSITSNTLGMF